MNSGGADEINLVWRESEAKGMPIQVILVEQRRYSCLDNDIASGVPQDLLLVATVETTP